MRRLYTHMLQMNPPFVSPFCYYYYYNYYYYYYYYYYLFPLSNVWLFLKERGRCVALDTCACDFGWTGASCALPDCSAVDQCSGKGECVSSNQCRCYPGFVGASCSKVADCSIFANCSGHGTCLSMTSGNASCRYGSRVMLLLFIYLFIAFILFLCLFFWSKIC